MGEGREREKFNANIRLAVGVDSQFPDVSLTRLHIETYMTSNL
jgi:hypothetical protein